MVKFTLPEFVGGDEWLVFIDTNDAVRKQALTSKPSKLIQRCPSGSEYEVTGRSLLLFAALTSGEPANVMWRIAHDLMRRM